MVEDYGGYQEIFRQGVTELACLAQCRRKFCNLQAHGEHPVAEEALRRIGEWYAIEAPARDKGADERRVLRQHESRPRLAALHDWLVAQRVRTAEGSGLAWVIDCTLHCWVAVMRYVEDGELPIDNPCVENAMRPIALGRKNWLFTDSEQAECRTAATQTLLGTAKLNGLEPHAWLQDTLEKPPTWPYRRIDDLLPLRAMPH